MIFGEASVAENPQHSLVVLPSPNKHGGQSIVVLQVLTVKNADHSTYCQSQEHLSIFQTVSFNLHRFLSKNAFLECETCHYLPKSPVVTSAIRLT
jgi:hypothetical protein